MIYKQGAKAQSITKELLDRLNNLAHQGRPTSHEIDQIIFSAKKLQRVDLGSYHYVIGICECLRGNIDAMRKEFEAAFAIDPGLDIYEGYNLALAHSNFHREVVQRHYEILRNDSSEPGYVAIAADGILNYGLIKDYLELAAPKLKRFGFDSSEIQAAEMLESLTKSGLSQESLSEVVYAAFDAFSELDCQIYARQVAFDSSDGDMAFIVRLALKGSAQELNALESSVISRLIEKNMPAYNADIASVIVAPVQG